MNENVLYTTNMKGGMKKEKVKAYNKARHYRLIREMKEKGVTKLMSRCFRKNGFSFCVYMETYYGFRYKEI